MLNHKIRDERGSALVYILIAIALLAALTLTFMEPSSQQTSSQNTFKTVSGLEAQVNMIRSAIQECVLSYPKGDQTIGPNDPDANDRFPIKPNSKHFDGAIIGPADDNFVKDIRCPGNKMGPDANDHAKIFSGSTGKFMPPPPDLFEDWRYYNGLDGVFFWTATSKSDSFLEAALAKIDDKFAECEADVIVSGGAATDLDSTGEGGVECPANNACFRLYLTANPSAAVPHQDTDCP
jgi:hypothetical protein